MTAIAPLAAMELRWESAAIALQRSGVRIPSAPPGSPRERPGFRGRRLSEPETTRWTGGHPSNIPLRVNGFPARFPQTIEFRASARSNLSGAHSIDGWSSLLLLSGIAGFGSFAWAVRGHFVGDKTPRAMQFILALSLAGILIFLFAIGQTSGPDWRSPAGFCLHLLAIALFGWAVLATRQNRPAIAFAGDRPARVFRSGPYCYIRHPSIRLICFSGWDARWRPRPRPC